MANELFIKHKLVDEIPSSPEVGSIYYERKTGIEKVVESNASIVEVGNIEKMLSAKIGEGQNSNIFNDLDNVASGDNSHAEGSNTTASGQCAHTEGSSTTASGESSHAEGYNTVAAGDYSHAEGYGTVTNNTSEHAEGSWNISTDNTVFSIGNGTDAENRSNLYEVHSDGSVFVKNVGDYNGTNAENATDLATILNDTVDKVNTINTTIFQTKTDESLSTTDKTIVGAINEINSKPTGVGKIDPNNSYGTGEIFNDYEVNVATGAYSHAEGSNTEASKNSAHAEGKSTIASGQYSHAEGYNTESSSWGSHAEGSQTKASDQGAHAEGKSSEASALAAHAEGITTTASGLYSHAEGSSTFAVGTSSHAEGGSTKTTNPYEHAQGYYNVSNTGSTDVKTIHSIGIGTSSTGRRNAQEVMYNGDHYIYGLGGYDGTNATSNDSKTLQEVINGKQDTLVSGASIKTINGESLLGSGDIEITGGSSAAVGKVDPNSDGTGEIFNGYEGFYANVASGQYSHAEGSRNNAIGGCSHAEGQGTTASGFYSHAEGGGTTASGHNSHAEGYGTIAAGGYSHAEGFSTQAFSQCEHAEGVFNKSYDSTDPPVSVIHSVGIGNSENNRKNAHEIKFNGDHYVYGVGNFDGTNSDTAQTLQEVINELLAKVQALETKNTELESRLAA